MPVDSCFNKLHRSNLFHPAMTIKTGMQHHVFAKIHCYMEDQTMPEKGDHVTELGVGRVNFKKAGSFLLEPFSDAEIRIVIKFNAELPAVELADQSPAVKERVLPAVRCVSDEKIMVKPHT